MYLVEHFQPTYCDNKYASATCQMECESESPTSLRKFSHLMRAKLRRTPSDLSRRSKAEQCKAQARQIELDFASSVDCYVRVAAPNGESTKLYVPASEVENVYSPKESGCGHGRWNIEVYDLSEHLLCTEAPVFDGVGSLHFKINSEYELDLIDKEWLHLPPASLCCY